MFSRPAICILLAAFAFFCGEAICQSSVGEIRHGLPVATGKWFNGIFPPTVPGGSGGWRVVDAFPNLRFTDPVKMVAQPRSMRLHVVGKDGFIWSFENDASTATKSLVLDIRTRVQATDNAGLVGLAFHPDFGLTESKNRGYFYVFYYFTPQPQWLPAKDTDSDGTLEGDETLHHTCVRLSRFTVLDGSTAADSASELVLLQQFDRQAWHNGGSLFFADDGFLHFSIGDEGLDSDYYRSMQRFNERLWGGVFRIDVDKNPGRSHAIRRQPRYTPDGLGNPDPLLGPNHTYSQEYFIPNDNPWPSPDGSQLEEYYALGIRSPHTMTYDTVSRSIWLGDVGQASWEEINFIEKGDDYQWPYREGTDEFFDVDFGQGFIRKTHTLSAPQKAPTWAYRHDTAGGTAVIGGYVYRGREHETALTGKYIFSDHGNPVISHIWALTPGATIPPVLLCDMPAGGFHWNIAAFGKDQNNEIYMISLGRDGASGAGNAFIPPFNAAGQWVMKAENGKILKLMRTGENVPEPPASLSQTGVFKEMSTLTAANSFVPYQPAAGFWSDGAVKKRWICIPNDGIHDSPGEQIGYSNARNWTFPEGTVFIKHFDFPVSETNPTLTIRMETRILVKSTDGSWYGLSYRWRANGSDADLLYDSQLRDFTITTPSGGTHSQKWYFPSRSDCITCHNPNAGSVLGFKMHQLNHEVPLAWSRQTGNQIRALSALGMLSPAPTEAEITAAPQGCDPNDLTQSLERRARSWLDVNCAACHLPGGANANWDARFSTPLANTTLINGALKKAHGIVGEASVRAHAPGQSIILIRSSVLGVNAMPPLAKNAIDATGVELLRAWINSLNPATYAAPGMMVDWYGDHNLTNFLFSRVEQGPLDFSWSGPPDPKVPADNFSTRWTTRIVPSATGLWQFHAFADDAIRLTVNGSKVIDTWMQPSSTREVSSPEIALTADSPADVIVEFQERTLNAGTTLRWSGPSLTSSVVPSSAFLLPSPGNGPPTAYPDFLTVIRGNTLSIPVTANDVDFENNLHSGSVQILRPPTYGTLLFNDGILQWNVPANTTLGSDSFTYVVADAAGMVSNQALVSLTIQSHAEAWRVQNFMDSSTNAWQADPDGDGFSNLLEYASGTLPLNRLSSPVVDVMETSSGIDFSFARVLGTETLITVETATDLTKWAASGPEVTMLENSGNRYVVKMNPVERFRKGFLRFRVSLTP